MCGYLDSRRWYVGEEFGGVALVEEMSLEVSQRPHLIPSMLSLPSANGSGGELSVVPADMPLLPVVESNPLKL